MTNYQTHYPAQVELYDGRKIQLNFNDNQERVLITETNTPLSTLQQIFKNEGFSETNVEEKKAQQITQGIRKSLTNEWDIHVRFLQVHENFIAIDAEVETSREYLEHINGKWISVIYEITSILEKYKIAFGIWHKKTQNYVRTIIQHGTLVLDEISDKIEWKPIVVGAVAGIAIGLILKALLDDE